MPFVCKPFLPVIIGALTLAMLGSAAQAENIVRFEVTGGNAGLARDLRAASSLIASEAEGRKAADELYSAARADYARLVNALYAKGYYSPVVHVMIDGREAASILPLDAPTRIASVVVTVDPGPPFTFSRTHVAPLARETRLPEDFAPGERAESGLVQEAVQAGIDGWRAVGHAKAEPAERRFAANHATRELSVDVALAPGPRLRFGPLTIKGYERMRESRIRKIAGLPEGEVFDPKVLARSAERLRRTGVFKSVTLTEDEAITSPDLLGITATVVEEKPRHYSLGAEIASFEGLDLTGEWIHRNLLGGGERLTLEGEISNIGTQAGGTDYWLGVTLDRPATLTPDTTLSFSFDLAHLDEEDYDADIASLGFSFSHWFSENLSGSAGLEYTFADVSDPSGDLTYKHLALPIGALWDSRDMKLDAKKGWFLDAEAKPFAGFGSTGSGLRLTLDGRLYRSFGETRPVTFALRGQLGAIWGPSLLATPRDDLFYSGGGGTVRGQPYQSLGVPLLRIGTDDFKIGGQAFLAASAEVRTRVTEKIGVVGFLDVGHIGATDFFDAAGDWHAGAGLGLRYDTGFGPIRLDVAAPVAGDTGDGVQIYIGIGQSF